MKFWISRPPIYRIPCGSDELLWRLGARVIHLNTSGRLAQLVEQSPYLSGEKQRHCAPRTMSSIRNPVIHQSRHGYGLASFMSRHRFWRHMHDPAGPRGISSRSSWYLWWFFTSRNSTCLGIPPSQWKWSRAILTMDSSISSFIFVLKILFEYNFSAWVLLARLVGNSGSKGIFV